VADFIRTHRPHVLLAEFGTLGAQLADSARLAGVPLFVHFHGFDASILPRRRAWVRRYRRLFQTAAGIIAPSRFLADRLVAIGCPAGKLHVSPYGIDADRFAAGTSVPGRLVAVGRLVEKKAPHLTIAAFARIAGRFPDARLDMIGTGPLERRCRELVAERGLSERAHLHGAQSHEAVVRLMREAAIFVQHSVTAADGDIEGMPVAILEAMASALPVVATRHSGIAEAVEDGVTGLLVEEHDVDGMAAAIAELLARPDRAAAMGAAGRARVLAHFTQDHARDRLRAILKLPLPAVEAVEEAG
jgi:glycosyltransferase involved in cell wall biosynthesis